MSGDFDLNSAHGGLAVLLLVSFFCQRWKIFLPHCPMLYICAVLTDLGQLVVSGFSVPVKIGTRMAVHSPFEGSFECTV